MSAAQLRLSLTEDETALLDAQRGPATRTAYALYLLVETLRRQEREGLKHREGEAAMWTIEFPHETIGGANDLCRQADSGLVASQGGRLGFEATGSREAVNALAELLNQRGVGFYLART